MFYEQVSALSLIPASIRALATTEQVSRYNPLDSFKPSKARDMTVLPLAMADQVAQMWAERAVKLSPMVKQVLSVLGQPEKIWSDHSYSGEIMPLSEAYFRSALMWETPSGGKLFARASDEGVYWIWWEAGAVSSDNLFNIFRSEGFAEALEMETIQEGEFPTLREAVKAYIAPNWEINLFAFDGKNLGYNPRRKTWTIGKGRVAFRSPSECWKFVQENSHYSDACLSAQIWSASEKFKFD